MFRAIGEGFGRLANVAQDAFGLDSDLPLTQDSYGLGQALLEESVQIFVRSLGRFFQRTPMPGSRFAHRGRVQVEQIEYEVVGVLCGQVVPLEDFSREILQVEGHDDACAAVNACSDHMPIIRVWKLNGRDQIFEAGDKAVAHMGVHQCPGPFQIVPLQLRSRCKEIPNPFIVNEVGPASPV